MMDASLTVKIFPARDNRRTEDISSRTKAQKFFPRSLTDPVIKIIFSVDGVDGFLKKANLSSLAYPNFQWEV
jgi:hypothetical protein